MSYIRSKFNLLDEGPGYGDDDAGGGGGYLTEAAPQSTQMQAQGAAPEAGGLSDVATKTAPSALSGNPYLVAASFAANLMAQKAQDERARRAQEVQIAQTDNQNKQSIYGNQLNSYGKALLR